MAWEPDYATIAQYKDLMKVKDDKDDLAIGRAITAASRAIDRYCSERPNGLGGRRQFGKVDAPEARYYTPRWDRKQARWVVEIDDLISAVGLTVAVDLDNNDIFESTITNYVLRPRDAAVNNRSYTQVSIGIGSAVQPYSWPDSIRLTTDQWGWASVPTTVVEATLLQTNRVHKKRLAPFKDTGNASSGTTETINIIHKLDPEIETMLDTYVKLTWT